jgi:CheY-like chemotaxis protein
MCRVKPLMIACTADSSEDVKKNAESVGFDLVITAPLTEKKVKEFILPLIRKKREKKK